MKPWLPTVVLFVFAAVAVAQEGPPPASVPDTEAPTPVPDTEASTSVPDTEASTSVPDTEAVQLPAPDPQMLAPTEELPEDDFGEVGDPDTDNGGPQAVEGEVLGYFESRGYGIQGLSSKLSDLRLPAAINPNAMGFNPAHAWAVINRVRPTLKLRFGDTSLVATALGETRHGFFERHPHQVSDVASVERLYLSIAKEHYDLAVGKQLLAWGSGLFLNPTDVLNQRAANDLNAERPGVWAIRTVVPTGDESNLQLAAAIEESHCCRPVVIGRYDFTWDITDVAGTAVYDERNKTALLGFDIKSELEVGAWVEGGWVLDLREPAVREPAHLLLEAGIDYSFTVLQQLYLAVEWIHQGSGLGGAWHGPSGVLPNYFSARVAQAAPSNTGLLGSNYALLLARLFVTSDWQVQWLGLANLRDPSGTSVLQLTWAATGSLELTAGGQLNFGEAGSEFNTRLPNLPLLPASVRGERLTPQAMAWLWGRVYF